MPEGSSVCRLPGSHREEPRPPARGAAPRGLPAPAPAPAAALLQGDASAVYLPAPEHPVPLVYHALGTPSTQTQFEITSELQLYSIAIRELMAQLYPGSLQLYSIAI